MARAYIFQRKHYIVYVNGCTLNLFLNVDMELKPDQWRCATVKSIMLRTLIIHS